MENHPSNGELALMIGSVAEKLEVHRVDSSRQNAAILEQATKTNGRVNSLEAKELVKQGEMKVIRWVMVSLLLPLGFLLVNYFLSKA